jgi:hypothetical protein
VTTRVTSESVRGCTEERLPGKASGLSLHQHPGTGPRAGGFDPGRYTSAPLQTYGLIRFAGSADVVFAQVANHSLMTDWVPLLKTVQVSQPQPLPPGESMIGTTRRLTLRGGITMREEIVYWDPPHGYAYTTEGKYWPLRDYLGFMSVQPAAGGGGDFIFREYFRVGGTVRQTLATPGVVIFGKRALGNLSKLIGGTSVDFRHVSAKPGNGS